MDRLEEKVLLYILDNPHATWVDIVEQFSIVGHGLRRIEDATVWLVEKAYIENDSEQWGDWTLTKIGTQIALCLKGIV